jgi:hypothetical protein
MKSATTAATEPTATTATEPAATTAMEPAHRAKAARALRSELARPERTIEHGTRLRTGRPPAAADPLLESRGR